MVTTLLNRPAAREIGYQMAQYIAKRITGVGGGVVTTLQQSIGVVPAGAVVVNLYSKVITAFSAGATIAVGSNSPAFNNLFPTVAITAGSEDLLPAAAFPQPLAADTEFFALVSGTPTAGDAVLAIQFIKPIS